MMHSVKYMARTATRKSPFASRLESQSNSARERRIKSFERDAVAALLRHLRAAKPTKAGFAGVWYPHTFETAAHARGEPLPRDHWTGDAPADFFDKTQVHAFRVRAHRSASRALDAFFAGPTISECGGVIAAAQWQVVRHTLGASKFDAVFGSAQRATHEMLRMRITGLATAGEPLAYFVDWGPTAQARQGFDSAQARVGDLYYIQGVPHYEAKHPDGMGRGYNVLYAGNNALGQPLFAGFDLDRACTEQEIRALLVDYYNQPRTLRARSYIKHSPFPSAYDLAREGLAEALPPGGRHAVGLLAGTHRRLRFDRLWQARDMSADELAEAVTQTLAQKREDHVAAKLGPQAASGI